MQHVPWSLAGRLLMRYWRSGEVIVLFAAMTIAVAAMSAVTFFTDRVLIRNIATNNHVKYHFRNKLQGISGGCCPIVSGRTTKPPNKSMRTNSMRVP